MRRYKSVAETSYQVVIHFIVAMVVLSALLPLVYVIGMSLTSQGELIDRNYFVIIPQEPTVEAYRRLLGSEILWRSIGISAFRAVVGPLLTLLLTVIGAFVLSRRDLPGRNVLLMFIVATILFRGGLIPTYLVMHDLQLLNTVWSLVLPTAVDAFGLLVIKMFHREHPARVDRGRLPGRGRRDPVACPDHRPAGRAGDRRDRDVQHRDALGVLVRRAG